MVRQRKKKGRPVSGWLVFDKPVGMGSTEAVSKIKWLYGAQKAGHAGTLDPLASGMLPVALGEATKTVPYVMDGTKTYRFTVTWGEERATDDLEGDVIATSAERPERTAIEALLPNYTGIIMQVPPQFSAIKIAGERAYDIARDGDVVDIPAREIEIDRIEIVDMPDDSRTMFEIECGKGTYVRSLARDIGRDLGCYGHVSELRRTEVSPFVADDLVTLEILEHARQAGVKSDDAGNAGAKIDYAALDALLTGTAAALEGLPHALLGEDAAGRVRSGNPVVIKGRDAPVEADDAYVTCRGRLIAIGTIEAGQFKPRRVFAG